REFMPFQVAWTDNSSEESFLEWHQSALRDWRPYDWRLELVAFLDGRPIGCQGLTAKQFGSTRRASTGSWLGASWQGRGLGTEMRRAVLTLLFDGLHRGKAALVAVVGKQAATGALPEAGVRGDRDVERQSPRHAGPPPRPRPDAGAVPAGCRRPHRGPRRSRLALRGRLDGKPTLT